MKLLVTVPAKYLLQYFTSFEDSECLLTFLAAKCISSGCCVSGKCLIAIAEFFFSHILIMFSLAKKQPSLTPHKLILALTNYSG